MANLITVGRLVLLFVVIWFIYRQPVDLAILSMILIAAVFAGDGLDGWVARRRGSTSRFGAIFDIAGDRIVEMALWVAFADLDVIGVWVPMLVISRGAIVDALRSASYAEGMTAFGESNMMRSALTRWLTAGRFMRALYGYAKAIGFVFLTGLVAFRHPDGAGTLVRDLYEWDLIRGFGWLAVWSAVALTVIRGLPVIVDAMPYFGQPESKPAEAPTTLPRTADPTRASGNRG